MIPRLPSWPGMLRACWVVPAIVAWKLVLIAGWSLPPPGNDAFFFDGAVVNYLRHGAYVNPSITALFPTSGTVMFGAYVPGYQLVLFPWMAVFGPTAAAGLWLHGVLFAGFAGLFLTVARQLALPARATSLGGLFLLAITFHDRPDSVAQIWGMAAVYGWVRVAAVGGADRHWGAGLALALAACALTNLHVFALYWAVLAIATVASARLRVAMTPWAALAVAMVLPALAAVATARWWPTMWAGLMENLRATPSVGGGRVPQLDEALKVGRMLPGIALAAVTILLAPWRGRNSERDDETHGLTRRLAVAIVIPSVVAMVLMLTVFTANFVHDVAYLQPLAVAALPAVTTVFKTPLGPMRVAMGLAVTLVAVRPVGLTTWGVVCAMDYPRRAAEDAVRRTLKELPAGSRALVSSALLYAAAEQQRIECRHTDWAGPLETGPTAFRPESLILTAFDYHRRLAPQLAALTAAGRVRVVSVEQHGNIRPPDAFSDWQRVVQHVSWAPVVVKLEWR